MVDQHVIQFKSSVCCDSPLFSNFLSNCIGIGIDCLSALMSCPLSVIVLLQIEVGVMPG